MRADNIGRFMFEVEMPAEVQHDSTATTLNNLKVTWFRYC